MSNYQSNEIKLINTSLIDPHPDNPRKQIGDVTDLAASIKSQRPALAALRRTQRRALQGHRRPSSSRRMQAGRHRSRAVFRA